MKNNYKRLSLFGLFSLICVLLSPSAFAHKVNVFAYVENNSVFVDGYFVDGKKVMKSPVTVYGDDDQIIYEGKTDSEGMLNFPLPDVNSALRVSINAGAGHRGEYTIPAEEVTGVLNMAEAVSQSASESVEGSSETSNTGSVSQAQLEAAVKKAVGEAIKPLVRELAASQEHVSFSQMVGGVGYIFGFMGLLAFMSARKKDAESKEK